jgi:cell wall-associated NlpC family hydrolase
MTNWYDKYINLPYKHLGIDPNTGIDCFNLIRYIYKQELNIDIPYTTKDFCDNPDVYGWYSGATDFPMERAATEEFGWIIIEKKSSWNEILELHDVVLMKVGSTNCINHAALVVDINGRYKKLLHTMADNPSGSWLAPYGKIYESNYTERVVRWIGLNN